MSEYDDRMMDEIPPSEPAGALDVQFKVRVPLLNSLPGFFFSQMNELYRANLKNFFLRFSLNSSSLKNRF